MLLLVSPTGATYHLVDLVHDEGLTILRWRAGARTVDAVQFTGEGGGSAWVRVDLLTGAITEAAAAAPVTTGTQVEHDLGWTWDGRKVVVVWDMTPMGNHYDPTPVYLRAFDGTQTRVQDVTWYDQNGYGLSPMLDPTGTRLLFWSPRVPTTFSGPLSPGDPRLDQFAQVLDLRTGAVARQVIDMPDACSMVDWFADSTVLAACGPDTRWNLGSQLPAGPSADGWPDGDHLAGYRLDILQGSAPQRLYDMPGEPVLGAGTTTPDGIWLDQAGTAGGSSLQSFWPAAPGTPRTLNLPPTGTWSNGRTVASVGGTVYLRLEALNDDRSGTYRVGLASMAADGQLTELYSAESPESEDSTTFVIGS